MKQVKFIILLTLMYQSVVCQITKADYYNKIDNTIFVLSRNKQISFDSIVSAVTRLYPKTEDRVRAYYTWIALNISYDTERLKAMERNGKMALRKDSSQEANLVFRKRQAVCEGFSKLMNKFCEASSINSQMVIGYTKMPTGEIVTDILHAWNAVKIDSVWKLLDVTWSNGYVGPHGLYYKHFSDKYFITNASFQDHLPLDPIWQLSDKPVSKNYFFKTDTLHKYVTSGPFSYYDSISAYKKQAADQRAYLDYIHYHNYDTSDVRYLNAADALVYNKAVEILNDAALDFEEYIMFYSQKFSKDRSAANCKKAKVMLERSEARNTEVLKYLENKSALSQEFKGRLNDIRKSANGNLNVIKQHSGFITQLQKSSSSSRKR